MTDDRSDPPAPLPFATDLHGQSWRPCAGCPHAEVHACPSRRQRALCPLVARDPARWGPVVRAQPPEYRPGAVRSFVSVPLRPAPGLAHDVRSRFRQVPPAGPPRSGHARYSFPWLAPARSGRGSPSPPDQGSRAVRVLRLTLGCPWRGPRQTTGCDCLRTCWRGKGSPPGLVRAQDCRDCVQLEWPLALPAPHP